jgi:hypothetical protein
MAEFRVVIDGKLSAEKQRAINAAIQQAVLPHLADLGGNSGPVGAIIPHREWWGLVARRLDAGLIREQFPQVVEIQKQIRVR